MHGGGRHLMQGGERSARVWTVFDWIMLKPLVWLLLHTSPEFEPWAGLRISLHIGEAFSTGMKKFNFYGILSDLLHVTSRGAAISRL